MTKVTAEMTVGLVTQDALLNYVGKGPINSSGLTVQTGKLVGRSTASTGPLEELSVGEGLILENGMLKSSGAVLTFATQAENAAAVLEGKVVDPLGVRECLNAIGTAPMYAYRAWVAFDGTGTVAIRASGNVSSVVDTGVGQYTINFTQPMQDDAYAVFASACDNFSNFTNTYPASHPLINQFTLRVADSSPGLVDRTRVFAGVIR